MRILFGAQGSILRVFCEIDQRLRSLGKLEESAYWISDSEFYFTEAERNRFLKEGAVDKLFEWDFTQFGSVQFSAEQEKVLEKKYAGYNLWDAVLADRRLMYGDIAKTRQAYQGKFSHRELRLIIFRALDAIEHKVAQFKPDVIITFVPATFGDYLLSMVASLHGIRYLQLRSTKVKNYVTFADTVGAASTAIIGAYHSNLSQGSGYAFEKEAEKFVKEGSARPIDYEGTLVRSKRPMVARLADIFRKFVGAARKSLFPSNAIVRSDNHTPPPVRTWLHASLLGYWHQSSARRSMKRRMVDLESLNGEPYLFYPLHSEPEIALSVYGRDHQNQIETIRRLAQSIPMGWRLIVKEHPKTFGYRTSEYYRKLLEIPNVWFADPDTRPFYWIEQASAVATISGFVGFEALMLGRPVIVLGDVSFSMLPRSMVRKVNSMSEVAAELNDLLCGFRRDEEALKAFIAANMQQGRAVNLYSDLLAKPGRNSSNAESIEAQYQGLVDLLLNALGAH